MNKHKEKKIEQYKIFQEWVKGVDSEFRHGRSVILNPSEADREVLQTVAALAETEAERLKKCGSPPKDESELSMTVGAIRTRRHRKRKAQQMNV